jgi:hypothetical protein
MSYLVPPEGATDDEIEKFIGSLRREARSTVRGMIRGGASEDEIVDYINSLGSDADLVEVETSTSPEEP